MKNSVYVLLMMLALSCSKKEISIPTINLAEKAAVDVNPDFLLNDIVENVTYTQLETRDSLFHAGLRLHSINDNGDYCFEDGRKQSEISIYDKEGKLISNFNRTGHGQGEFLGINSLLYDGDDKIEVLDTRKNIVYQYNRKGEYQSKMDVQSVFAMRPLEGGKYLSLVDANKENKVIDCVRIIDAEGNVCNEFLPIDTTKIDGTIIQVGYVARCGDGYNFLINTLNRGDIFYNYNINNNSVSEICKFNVGAYGVTPEVFINGGNPNERILLLGGVYKMNNFIFVGFFNRGPYCTDIWDLTTCKMIARRSAEGESGGNLNYKLPNGEIIKIPFMGFTGHNDQLIFTCPAASLAGKIPQTIDPEGNDVIVTFKLK